MGNMSGIEYARRNLACTSWHKAPKGWWSFRSHVSGYTLRPFCRLHAGHAGDHEAYIESIEQYPQETQVTHYEVPKDDPKYGKTFTEIMTRPKDELMTWPNKLGIPDWLLRTTRHGISVMREHGWTMAEILEIDDAPTH